MYKIISLSIENLKKISAIDISPKGQIIEVSGKNGQGKTTVLDGIQYAFTGTIPDDVIKHGEENASIEIDVGEFKIKKTMTKNGNYLNIKNTNGEPIKSPQSFLDKVIGNNIAFDPVDFLNRKPDEQKKVLFNAMGIDIDKINAEYKTIFDNRTAENRELDRIKRTLENYSGMKEVEEINISDLTNQAIELNNAMSRLNQIQDNINNSIRKRDLMKTEIQELEEKLLLRKEEFKKVEKDIESMKNPENEIQEVTKRLNDIVLKISTAETQNNEARKYKDKVEFEKQMNSQKIACDNLTEKLEGIKKTKDDLLSKSNLPGISIDDEGVKCKGILLQNLSQSEKIKVCLSISVLVNPTFKVILIRDGSLLDNDSMEQIRNFAKTKDYQIWIEKVATHETAESGITIHDVA